MAYPTGSGSEKLWRTCIIQQSNTETAFRFDGTNATTGTSTYTVPALHIITVLNIVIHNQGTDPETMSMWVVPNGSGIVQLLQNQPIEGSTIGSETFVWNDRIVLVGGDALKVNGGSPSNQDLYLSYIDQDWS